MGGGRERWRKREREREREREKTNASQESGRGNQWIEKRSTMRME